MKTEFARPWNTTGKTWITASVPGPWAIDNSLPNVVWGIIHTGTGRTKKIGKVSGRGVNYFDRAAEEANKRNLALLQNINMTEELAGRIISENPEFCGSTDEGTPSVIAKQVISRMLSAAGYEYPCHDLERREELVRRVQAYH